MLQRLTNLHDLISSFNVATTDRLPCLVLEMLSHLKIFSSLGGTDQVYFSTTDHPEHHKLFLLANSTKYGWVLSKQDYNENIGVLKVRLKENEYFF